MVKTTQNIINRIELLQSRGKDNSAIIAKLKRELRKLKKMEEQ